MSFLASLPANLAKFSYIVVGIPTYIYSSDTASSLETVTEREFELLDWATSIEIPIKVVSDISTLIDESKPITILTSDTSSLTEKTTYMSKETRDTSTLTDLVSLKIMIIKERAKTLEYAKTMGLEGTTPEQLEEYEIELPTLIGTTIPNLLAIFRYVKEGDMVLASDFNEILASAKNAMKIILALVNILLDNNVDMPKEVMKLITEVMDVLW